MGFVAHVLSDFRRGGMQEVKSFGAWPIFDLVNKTLCLHGKQSISYNSLKAG